jgi:RNA polymerase sigma factor (sigma-70 family)
MTTLHGSMRKVPSEGVLVDRLAAGDSAALWELWQHHQGELRGLCRRWMGGHAEDAEDALSTAMLKTCEILPSQAADLVNVRGWLLRLTYNVCMDLHREHQRRARLVVGLGAPDVPSPDSAVAPHSPEEALLRRELRSWVRHAIHDLPPRLKEPLVLRIFREMPHRDIAERLKLSSDNVRKRLQYARGILGLRLGRLLTGPAASLSTSPRTTAVAGPVRAPTPRERRRLATLNRYVERHPRGWKKRLELARLLEAMGHREEAQAEYGRARDRSPATWSVARRAS